MRPVRHAAALCLTGVLASVSMAACGSSSYPELCTLAADARALAATVDKQTSSGTYDKVALAARVDQLSDRANQLSKPLASASDLVDDLTNLSNAASNVATDIKGGFSGTALPSDKQDLADLGDFARTLHGDASC